jgi:hypothetical protein
VDSEFPFIPQEGFSSLGKILSDYLLSENKIHLSKSGLVEVKVLFRNFTLG